MNFQLSEFKDYRFIKTIKEGWSSDEKYMIEKNNKMFLLRISKKNEKKEEEFKILKFLTENTKIPIAKPIKFGFLNSEEKVYTIYSWIKGENAKEVLKNYSLEEQFNFGFKAGEYLKIIHLTEYTNKRNWEYYFSNKIKHKMELYEKSGIYIEREKEILNCIENNKKLLKNRNIVIQHGDYHVGNFVINTEENFLSIIDFDRLDFGDPWEEFTKIVWCKNISKEFAYGRILGYFKTTPPEEFWKILSLYMAFSIISSIAWAASFGSDQIQVIKKQTQDILNNYDNFNELIPKWIKEFF